MNRFTQLGLRLDGALSDLAYEPTRGQMAKAKEALIDAGRYIDELSEAARDLVENIRENGVHDNWKSLANKLKE